MTKKELVWRLASKPTIDDITKLIETKVITPEEARTIAFNSLDENDKVAKLEAEIELLKEAIQRLQQGTLTRTWINTPIQYGTGTSTFSINAGRLLNGIIDL